MLDRDRRYEGITSSDSSSDSEDSDSDQYVGATCITVKGKTTRITGGQVVHLPYFENLQLGDGHVTVVSHGHKSSRHHSSHHHHHQQPHKNTHPERRFRHKLTDSVSCPSRRDLNHISKNIGKTWRQLGLQLGLSRGQIEAIEVDHHVEGHHEMAYQTLLKWQRQSGGRGTLKDLAEALDSVGMSELATEIPVR